MPLIGMNFFAELKRRNVYRVAIAYSIAGWLLLQFASTFVPILGLPEWVPRLIFLLLVIGLVPTVIAAWALELTPEGIKLEKNVDRNETETVQTGRKLNFFIIGTLVLIIVFLIVERVFIANVGEPPPVTVIDAGPNKTIAVLPFADLSKDRSQEWFADGLAEEILNALARTPDLMVSSRTSAFTYKGSDKDISTIAKELGVAHILEGSIRGTGKRIRVTAQLIRAADGFHIWSQTYDRDLEDVIGIQEDVALRIANALQTTMDPKALQDMVRVGTRSVRAYQAYIQGLSLRARSFRTSNWQFYLESYEQFEEARRIEPRFAVAHRESADYWKVQMNPVRRQTGLTDLKPPEMRDKFRERIDLAIETAKDSIEVIGSRAQRATVGLHLRNAIRFFQEYLEARPHDYQAWNNLLVVALLAADRDAGAIALAELKAAGEFDRVAAAMYVGNGYRFGKASVAADYGLKALERWPNHTGISYQTHRSLLWAMRVDEAATLFARINQNDSGTAVTRSRQACAEGRRDDVLRILEDLRRADNHSLADEWLILMMLGDKQAATELLQVFESNGVTYQLASWLSYHTFDPGPFPSLMQMLQQERVKRPPPAEIPFACPAD